MAGDPPHIVSRCVERRARWSSSKRLKLLLHLERAVLPFLFLAQAFEYQQVCDGHKSGDILTALRHDDSLSTVGDSVDQLWKPVAGLGGFHARHLPIVRLARSGVAGVDLFASAVATAIAKW
jgi:hypothetical protein